MNWRPYPYIALAFFSRRMVQFMLLALCLFSVTMFSSIFRMGPAQARLEPHFRLNWEYEFAYLAREQRLDLDRAGLMSGKSNGIDLFVSYLELRNSRKGADGRSIQFIPEPLGREELARIVQRFPALRSLKVWGHVSAEGWPGLTGAQFLKHLEIQDGTGSDMASLETLPHLPALERVVARIGSSATLLKGLGRNNPQVRQLMLSDIYVAQRGQNLPVFPLEGLTNVKEVAIHPSTEPAEGEQLFAKWDPNHSVMSKGYRLSPPSAELIAALRTLPKLERVYCCDWSAGDWGVSEIREGLGGRVAVEQGTVVRIRNQGQPFIAAFVGPSIFFLVFLLTFQGGSTFAHELSRTVPNYARPHLIVFGAAAVAMLVLFTCVLKTLTGHWLTSVAYAVFISGTTAAAFGGKLLQLRPKWAVSLLHKVFLPALILLPILPAMTQWARDGQGEQPYWLSERLSDLLTLLLAPPPLLIAASLAIGVTCGLWYFSGFPRLASRLQAENARGAFIHPFDQSRADVSWPANVQGPRTAQVVTLGHFPDLESPVIASSLLGRDDGCNQLGRTTGFGQRISPLHMSLWAVVFWAPFIAFWYRKELMTGDLIGGLLLPVTRFGLLSMIALVGIRLAAVVSRRPYCPYEAILPMTRADYHAAIERLHWRMVVQPSAWVGIWCLLASVLTLWRNGGDRPLDVLAFHGLLGTMVAASAFAASEFARWALTIRSDSVVMFVGLFLGMPLLQCVTLTTAFGQFSGDMSSLMVVGLLGGNLGAFVVGILFYVINSHRYRNIEWGKLG